MEADGKVLTIRIPEKLHRTLKIYSATTGRSINETLNAVISKWWEGIDNAASKRASEFREALDEGEAPRRSAPKPKQSADVVAEAYNKCPECGGTILRYPGEIKCRNKCGWSAKVERKVT